MKVDLVFEGGGVTGISYAGAVKALEEGNFTVNRCAGTSAGSIISSLIIAGYNSKELVDILNSTDFNIFLKKTVLGKICVVGKPLSMIFDKGLYDSRIIETWLEGLLKKKGISKFKDVTINGECRLKIIAADVTRRKMLILPDDLKDYGIDSLNFSIAKAVRMSCAIPFFFTPYILKYGGKTSFIVDGGLLSSFPIWIFDIEGIPRWPTLGIKIKDLDSYTSQGKTDIISYAKDIIDAPINESEENFIRYKDYVRTIVIDYDGKIGATGFHKANNFISDLYSKGYKSTMSFIEKWDFKKYIRSFSSY